MIDRHSRNEMKVQRETEMGERKRERERERERARKEKEVATERLTNIDFCCYDVHNTSTSVYSSKRLHVFQSRARFKPRARPARRMGASLSEYSACSYDVIANNDSCPC